MSRKAKVYWSVVGLAFLLAVATAIVGLVGVLTDSHTLMGYMTAMIFVVFAVIGVIFFIRGGMRTPHPR